MAREPAPDVKITEGIVPAAQVHDTYWRPAQPEPSPLHEVARELAKLGGELTDTFEKMDAKAAEDMKGQGLTAFYTGGMTGQGGPTTDAIGQGYKNTFMGQPNGLPLFGSKAATVWQRENAAAAGYAEGFPMQGRVMEAYDALPPEQKYAMSPEQFNQWALGQIRNDPASAAAIANPAMARGIGPQMRELHTKLLDRWNKEKIENAKSVAVNTWSKAITATLEDASIKGQGQLGGTDYAQVTADIDAIRKAGSKILPEQIINQQVAAGIIERAKLERDPQLLTVLDNLKDADGKRMSLSPEINKAKLDTLEQIKGLRARDRNEEWTLQQHNQKLAHDGSLRNITSQMAKDPNFTPDPKDMRNVLAYDPDFEVKLINMRKTLADPAARLGVEDPIKIQQALRDIYSGKGWDAYRQVMPDIKTVETEKKLHDAVTQMEAYAQNGNGLFEDTNWKRMESFMLDAGKGNQGVGGPAFREPALTAASLAAINDARAIGMKWAIAHPGASALERQQFIAELTAQFVPMQGQPGAFSKDANGPVYNQPPAIREARGGGSQRPGTTPAASDGNAPAGNVGDQNPMLPNGARSTAAPPGPKGWIVDLMNSPDAPPRYEGMKGLSEEYRKDIERIAKEKGRDPQWVIDQAWKLARGNVTAARKMVGPTPAPAAAPQPQPPVVEQPQGTPGNPEAVPSNPTEALGGAVRRGIDTLRTLAPSVLPNLIRGQQRSEAPNFQAADRLALAATQNGLDLNNPRPEQVSARPDTAFVQLASLGKQPMQQHYSSHLDLAKSLLGKSEHTDRSALIAFFKESTGSSIDPATTPWCARFANSVLAASGEKGSGSDMARSFLHVGQAVRLEDAKPGDIIVFPRGHSSVYGHVGFVESVNLSNGTVRVLGGNQGDAVSVKTFALGRALGVRRVTKNIVQAAARIADDNTGVA